MTCSSDLGKLCEKGIVSRHKKNKVFEFYLTEENKKKFQEIHN